MDQLTNWRRTRPQTFLSKSRTRRNMTRRIDACGLQHSMCGPSFRTEKHLSRGGSNSWTSTVAVPKQSTLLICSVERWLLTCFPVMPPRSTLPPQMKPHGRNNRGVGKNMSSNLPQPSLYRLYATIQCFDFTMFTTGGIAPEAPASYHPQSFAAPIASLLLAC